MELLLQRVPQWRIQEGATGARPPAVSFRNSLIATGAVEVITASVRDRYNNTGSGNEATLTPCFVYVCVHGVGV